VLDAVAVLVEPLDVDSARQVETVIAFLFAQSRQEVVEHPRELKIASHRLGELALLFEVSVTAVVTDGMSDADRLRRGLHGEIEEDDRRHSAGPCPVGGSPASLE